MTWFIVIAVVAYIAAVITSWRGGFSAGYHVGLDKGYRIAQVSTGSVTDVTEKQAAFMEKIGEA